MKHILLFLVFFLAERTAIAQSGSLWASAAKGGCYGFGTILRGDSYGNFKTVACFDSLNGSYPIGKMAMAANGKLYGVTYYGTDLDSCCVFNYDTLADTITIVYSFFSDTTPAFAYGNGKGGQPLAGLILASNGLIYGTTSDGGANGVGVIYSVDPVTNSYTDVYDFTGTTGSNPVTELLEASDGKLYGITSQGGMSNGPVLFRFDPSGNTYTALYYYDLAYTFGNYTTSFASTVSDLVQGVDGKLYGTLTYNTLGPLFGMLFSYDLTTGVWTQLYGFNDPTLQAPHGGITPAGAKICGTLTGGLFVYDINTNKTTTTPFANNYITSQPTGLSTIGDNKLIGCMAAGGDHGDGIVLQLT